MITLHFPKEWNVVEMQAYIMKHWQFLWPGTGCEVGIVSRSKYQPRNVGWVIFPKPMVAAIKARGREVKNRHIKVTDRPPKYEECLQISKEVQQLAVLGSTERYRYAELQDGQDPGSTDRGQVTGPRE